MPSILSGSLIVTATALEIIIIQFFSLEISTRCKIINDFPEVWQQLSATTSHPPLSIHFHYYFKINNMTRQHEYDLYVFC